MDEVVTSDARAQERYLVSFVTEEAIRSSQLEGATTSRQVAKELLRSGREPKDRSERMIFNNYRALQFMRNEMGGPLTLDAVLDCTEFSPRAPWTTRALRADCKRQPRIASRSSIATEAGSFIVRRIPTRCRIA